MAQSGRTGRLHPAVGAARRRLARHLAEHAGLETTPTGRAARSAEAGRRAGRGEQDPASSPGTPSAPAHRAAQGPLLLVACSGGPDSLALAALTPELARRLERYAHQTLSLADDFVHLARAESGRFVVETFNLSDALLDSVDDLWPLADAKRIRIVSDVPETEALVTGDRALLTRSITNLLGNALKYSDERTHVQARIRLEDKFVIAEIEDQGRGIAEEDLGKLFEAFSRLAPPEGAPAATAAPGAGLGLAFVKAVVERHRGQVSVTSVEGKGSIFGMRLPRAKA